MSGAADRGEAEHLAAWRGDGVAAKQRRVVVAERFGQPGEKAHVVPAQRIAEQHAERLGPLGGKVGHVAGDELPGDIGGVLSCQIVHPFGHGVMGEHQRLAAHFEHRAIVGQPARGGMGGEAAQGGDEGGFGGHDSVTLARCNYRRNFGPCPGLTVCIFYDTKQQSDCPTDH